MSPRITKANQVRTLWHKLRPPLPHSQTPVLFTAATPYTKHHLSTMSKGSPFDAKIDSIDKLESGKWIQTRKINYTDPLGRQREWEMAVRTTRTETTNIDAVSILAFLKYPDSGKTEIVLTKQFRPPTGKVMIELPAGLIDPKESIESTATRELYEETGYVGKFIKSSTLDYKIPIFSDPGLTNANMDLAHLDVDMTLPQNQNPVAKLEDGEFIDVFTVEKENLLAELQKLASEEGCAVDARLYHLAIGIDLAK